MFTLMSFVFNLLTQRPALAAETKQWPYAELHRQNVAIADYLRNMSFEKYESISRTLKNPADQDLFKKIYVDLKGKAVKAFPVLDCLVVGVAAEKHVICIEDRMPLKITVDNRSHFEIDPSNISRSLNRKSRKFSGFDWTVPEARAGNFVVSSEEEEKAKKWGFIYAALGITIDLNAKSVEMTPRGLELRSSLADEIEKIVGYFGMKKMTCGYDFKKMSDETAYGITTLADRSDAYALTFSVQGDEEYVAGCNRRSRYYFCHFRPIKTNSSSSEGKEAVKATLENVDKALNTAAMPILEWVAKNVRLGRRSLRPEDLVLVCSKDGSQQLKEKECHADTIESLKSHYGPFEVQKLNGMNLLEKPELKGHFKDYLRQWRVLDPGQPTKEVLNPIKYGAMSALEKCCRKKECREEAWKKTQLEMNNNPAASIVE